MAEYPTRGEIKVHLESFGIVPGQIYRDHKGGLCTIIAVGLEEEGLEPMVVYRSNRSGLILIRKVDGWNSDVVVNGRPVNRFVLIGG